ncbi:MAG: hypothetical protein JO047_08515, partial [Alphaproteobacteria bacterium]|nr:hypothetical protein [Alphaproteobacteria bacterium]
VSPMAPGEAALQLAALQHQLGAPLHAVSLDLSPDGTTAELQNPAQPEVSDVWRVSHLRLRALHAIEWVHVGGPDPVTSRAANLPVATLAFAPAQVDFGAVPALAAAAVQRVALEEPAFVSGMHLGKRWMLLPAEHVGDLEWRIEVGSAHERATAFADPAGRITGMNLDGTLRAKRVNLFAGGALLRRFADQLGSAFDNREQIRKLLIYSNFLQAEITDPHDPTRVLGYHSNINGVFRQAGLESPPLPPGMSQDAAFGTAEVDWDSLPRLLQVARERLSLPAAPISFVDLRKRARGLGQPAIEWEVSFAGSDSASITMDSGGRVLTQHSAHGAASRNMLQPDAIADFLGLLRRELDPQTQVMEIGLGPERASIAFRDPHDPRRIVTLDYRGYVLEKGIEFPQKPGTWMGQPFDDDWFFNLQDVDRGVLEKLPRLEQAGLERMQLGAGKIEGMALGRHAMILEGNRQLAVEMSAKDNAGSDRRVYLDLRGRLLRID